MAKSIKAILSSKNLFCEESICLFFVLVGSRWLLSVLLWWGKLFSQETASVSSTLLSNWNCFWRWQVARSKSELLSSKEQNCPVIVLDRTIIPEHWPSVFQCSIFKVFLGMIRYSCTYFFWMVWLCRVMCLLRYGTGYGSMLLVDLPPASSGMVCFSVLRIVGLFEGCGSHWYTACGYGSYLLVIRVIWFVVCFFSRFLEIEVALYRPIRWFIPRCFWFWIHLV